jgi:hypothetical protein
MKKIFTFFILAAAHNFSFSQTNIYHQFPDSNATWNIHTFQWCGLGFDHWEHFYSYTIGNDTVINTNIYHKLIVPIEVITSAGQCTTSGTWTSPGYYAGAFREDTSAKKIFFMLPFENTEQLLYDFTIQVGDTILGYFEHMCDPGTVIAIDSVLIGSDYRKRWITYEDMYDTLSIIEGNGNSSGLLELQCLHLDADEFVLTCFSQDGITLYPDANSSCDIIDHTNQNRISETLCRITPNPFAVSARLEIKDRKNGNENYTLSIFNTLGAVVRKKDFQKGESLEIEKGELIEALYFYFVSTENKMLGSGKFVIE